MAPHHRLRAQGHGPCSFLQRPTGAPSHRPTQRPPQGRDGHQNTVLLGRKGRNSGRWKSPMGRPTEGSWRVWVGASPPYLLSAAGGSHPTPAAGGRSSSLIFPNKMKLPGAWPAPCCPRPSPPQGSLQVLADDSLVMAEHVRDAAGAGPGRARRGSQQRQQERPERGLGGHLKGHQVRVGHPGLWRGSPLR